MDFNTIFLPTKARPTKGVRRHGGSQKYFFKKAFVRVNGVYKICFSK
jgi:hypothetical protein